MESMLLHYVYPELGNEQPFMRLRACYVYGVYSDLKYKDNNHCQQVVEAIFKNMNED
jgi:hypothetical protein